MAADRGFDERWMGAVIERDHWHFHRQLHARYGVILGPGEFSSLLRAIRSGKALRVLTRARGRSVYAYRLPIAREVIYVLGSRWAVFSAWPPNREVKEARRRCEAGEPL